MIHCWYVFFSAKLSFPFLLPLSSHTLHPSLRHPQATARPTPHDILLALMENEETVLRIPEDDAGTHSMAATLGAPLEAGHNMYRDLQDLYHSLQAQT